MIVLICGPDASMVRQAVTSTLDDYDPERANTSFIDGRSATLAEVVGQVGSPGFFGQRRVVVVSDLMARSSKAAKGSDPDDTNERSSLDLRAVFAGVAPDNVLILTDPSLAAVPAAIKKMAPRDVDIVLGEPPRGNALIAWMTEAAGQAGSSMDQPTARYLAELLFPRSWSTKPNNPRYDRPPDLDMLRNEIEKLATAAHPGAIQRRHIDNLSHSADQDQIFRFTDAVAQGRLPAALDELARLLEAGEDSYRLTAQLFQQMELGAVLTQAAGRLDPVAVGKDLGLTNPNRMSSIARTRRPGADSRELEAPLRTDRMTKRGELRLPEDGIYHLITTRSPTTKKGDT